MNRFAAALGNHPRRLTVVVVVLMAAAGWLWLIASVVSVGLAEALMPAMEDYLSARGIALGLAMWVAMIFAMMLPTAAPTFKAYADTVGGGALALIAGYTTVWLAASLVAVAVQTWLVHLGALAPHMAPAGVALSASILIAAGHLSVHAFEVGLPLSLPQPTRCRCGGRGWRRLPDRGRGRAGLSRLLLGHDGGHVRHRTHELGRHGSAGCPDGAGKVGQRCRTDVFPRGFVHSCRCHLGERPRHRVDCREM